MCPEYSLDNLKNDMGQQAWRNLRLVPGFNIQDNLGYPYSALQYDLGTLEQTTTYDSPIKTKVHTQCDGSRY